MRENKAVIWLILVSIALLLLHLIISSTFLRFVVFSYLIIVSISTFEILILRVRNNGTFGSYLPYLVLGMSLLKMIVSILWIFFALKIGIITTQSVMSHFFIPYFVMLALTAILMVKIMR